MWGIIFGLIIIFWGLSQLMGLHFNFFAITAIAIGAIILIGALRRTGSS